MCECVSLQNVWGFYKVCLKRFVVCVEINQGCLQRVLIYVIKCPALSSAVKIVFIKYVHVVPGLS